MLTHHTAQKEPHAEQEKHAKAEAANQQYAQTQTLMASAILLTPALELLPVLWLILMAAPAHRRLLLGLVMIVTYALQIIAILSQPSVFMTQ